MNEFSFSGFVPASKSLFNRALIVKSYFPELQLRGETQSDDVLQMKQGIENLFAGRPIECGHAGTVLRFLSIRASRMPGEHIFTGSERLFSRPIDELLSALRQLGCQVEAIKDKLIINSQGWRFMGDSLHVHSHRSSQFASGFLLNSWGLDKSFALSPGHKIASPNYFKMTLDFLRQVGLKFEKLESDYIVHPRQRINVEEYNIEPDMSCAFTIAALASTHGSAKILGFRQNSLQPDVCFVDLLKQMGAKLEVGQNYLQVSGQGQLSAIDFDLNVAPDLFPVLAVLCASARGESRLYGAKQLAFKESNRITKISELLTNLSVQHHEVEGGLQIKGVSEFSKLEFTYDCDQDHRLAMAAALARQLGAKVNLIGEACVSKSYPGFWELLGE